MSKVGLLDTVEIILPEWIDPEDRYRRTYKPVTPVSRVVTGADDQIAPETDIATWSITDWSAGEGDLRWKDRGRYNTSTGAGPISDGSGVSVGLDWVVAVGQSRIIARGGGRLVSVRDMDDSLYEWNGSAWVELWAIGGTEGNDAGSLAAVDADAWFVDDFTGIRKVTSSGNTLHYNGNDFNYLVVFEGVLYGLDDVDLYTIDQTSTDTRTQVYDSAGTYVDDTRVKLMSTSDVGPIWLATIDDGVTLLKEYNVASATGYTLGALPADVQAYDLFFHDGFYFATYRKATSQNAVGDAYLYYQKGDLKGSLGPFPADSTTAQTRVSIAGTIGDRIYLTFQRRMWVYDLSSGGLVMVADLSSSAIGDIYMSITYGPDVFCGSLAYVGKVNTEAFLADTAQTVSTGIHDYGYLGLPKMIHTVTVNTESVLVSSDKVEVGYSVDGGSTTYLANDFATGKASHQWTVSTNSASVIGTEIEWHLRLTTTSTSVAAKVVSLASDASGAKSRIEFIVLADLGQSSVVDGGIVLTALNALKTSHSTVQWSDPFQVREHESPETFDVRVLEVVGPEVDVEHTYAMVRMQTVGVVG